MKNGVVAILLVVAILAGAGAGYLVGSASPSTTTTIPSRPYGRVILVASCSTVGNTGAITAANVGVMPVIMTEIFVIEPGGAHTDIIFPHGVTVNPGTNATLSQGIEYAGNNVTIGALSSYGDLFVTTCPHAR